MPEPELNAARRATLDLVAATIVPEGAGPDLGRRLADKIALLPRAADRAQLALVLALLETRWFPLLTGGVPRRFARMSPAERERLFRRWAASRLPALRKAFQAFKRLATVVWYTATDASGRNPAWPALGYPGPLGPAPAVPKPLRPLPVTGDTTLDCDVVVIGSGAGGGVVAGELAAAGKDVVVLEKGDYLNEADFTQREGEMLERLYDGGGLLATDDLGLVILAGSCLGGGTVVNYTTSFHTPAAVREEWARGHALPHFASDEFTASLDAVATRIGVNTEHARPSGRDAVLIRGLERCGWHHGLLPRDVRGCTQDDACGYCGLGCRAGAKQSTMLTYLHDAHERGARIVVRAEARRVMTESGRAVGVEALVRSADGRRAFALTVRARAVVAACGSIHTPALLLRSGVAGPAVGRHLALHPATAVLGVMDEPVRPWTGTVQAHYSDQFADLDGGYGFKFETAPMHPSLAALALPWESAAGHRERMAALPHLTLVGILLRDRFGGRVSVDRDGAPVVRYRLSRYDARHLRRGIAAAAELLEAAGAREIGVPHARPLWYRPADGTGARARWTQAVDRAGTGANRLLLVTFHQMASCRMGGMRGESALNPDNEVWGVPGLFVADASAFPTASGVNPMLTIMAIAHRAARVIAARL